MTGFVYGASVYIHLYVHAYIYACITYTRVFAHIKDARVNTAHLATNNAGHYDALFDWTRHVVILYYCLFALQICTALDLLKMIDQPIVFCDRIIYCAQENVNLEVLDSNT